MSEKDFSGKLAAGMRRAKQPGAAEPTAPAAPNKSSTTAGAQNVTPRQTGEAASAGSENRRALHPKRVWPD